MASSPLSRRLPLALLVFFLLWAIATYYEAFLGMMDPLTGGGVDEDSERNVTQLYSHSKSKGRGPIDAPSMVSQATSTGSLPIQPPLNKSIESKTTSAPTTNNNTNTSLPTPSANPTSMPSAPRTASPTTVKTENPTPVQSTSAPTIIPQTLVNHDSQLNKTESSPAQNNDTSTTADRPPGQQPHLVPMRDDSHFQRTQLAPLIPRVVGPRGDSLFHSNNVHGLRLTFVGDELFDQYKHLTETLLRTPAGREQCDCNGSNNRYVYQPEADNVIVFVGSIMTGNWEPTSAFWSQKVESKWSFDRTSDLFEHHLSRIQPSAPTHIVLSSNSKRYESLEFNASMTILVQTHNVSLCTDDPEKEVICMDTSWTSTLDPHDESLNHILTQQLLEKVVHHQVKTTDVKQESNADLPATETITPEEVPPKAAVPDTVDLDPRPRGLRLAFLGDSLTRYQYVSLAYFLKHGKFWDANKHRPFHLVNEYTYGGYDKMYEIQTTDERFLYPNEKCDCYRELGYIHDTLPNVTENRYFYESSRDNMLVYIQAFGHSAPSHGRYTAEEAMENISSFQFKHFLDYNKTPYVWEFPDWGSVIREHIANLRPKITHLVLNAGIWGNHFMENETARVDLKQAVEESNMTGIWKTTTYQFPDGPYENMNISDPLMCELFNRNCLDLTWSNCVRTKLMYDPIHFVEPVYRIFNEDLLENILKIPFPPGYEREPKERNIRKEMKYCWVLPGGSVFNATPNRFEPIVFDRRKWRRLLRVE